MIWVRTISVPSII